MGLHSSFSSIVWYVRSVNILIDAKCLVSTKFAKYLLKDKHLTDENLSDLTDLTIDEKFNWTH